MEYRRIEYFLCVAETLNFTQAAAKLFITPQALAKQIALLEDEVGAKLLNRTTRSMALTPLGEECCKRFTAVVDSFNKTANDIKALAREAGETLRVGFFSALPKNEIVTPLLNLFSEQYSLPNIEIITGGLDEVRSWLENDEIDLCITNIHDYEHWEKYETVELVSTPARIVISSHHPWAEKSKITEGDIEQASILLLKLDRIMDSDSFYKKIRCKQRHYAQNFDVMLALLEIGNDFGVFPKVYNHMYHARFKYLDLPESMRFKFHTICACKKSNSRKKFYNIMSVLKNQSFIDFPSTQ